MIIGITGPICSGKDTLGRILIDKGFERFSLADEIRFEMKKKGIKLVRENIQDYGDLIRKNEGPGAWTKRVIPKIIPNKDYVIESVRNPGEVKELRKLDGFVLMMIDSPKKIRFERMFERAREKDPKTFEKFEMLEEKDLGVGQPSHGQQNAALFKLAESKIVNDGTIDDLRRKVEGLLEELKRNP